MLQHVGLINYVRGLIFALGERSRYRPSPRGQPLSLHTALPPHHIRSTGVTAGAADVIYATPLGGRYLHFGYQHYPHYQARSRRSNSRLAHRSPCTPTVHGLQPLCARLTHETGASSARRRWRRCRRGCRRHSSPPPPPRYRRCSSPRSCRRSSPPRFRRRLSDDRVV